MSDAISEPDINISCNPGQPVSQPRVRYADADTANQYPLPCQTQPLRFDPVGVNNQTEAQGWQLDVELPLIPADSVVIPSYTQLGHDNYRTQFTLVGEHGMSSLPCVPSITQRPTTSTAVTASQLDGVSTHIDYWLIAKQTSNLRLRLHLTGAQPNERYLLNLCIRPQQLAAIENRSLLEGEDLLGQANPVRPLSQRLGPNAIRGGICSPTATAMAMAQLTPSNAPNWPNFVAACRDGATGMYGVWPLNLYHASRLGHLGAIETLTQGAQARKVLNAQLPMVASIKYANGALQNAPQPQTSGHLVLLHGINQGKALVSDPAAPNLSEVRQEYPLDQFLDAWLSNRGACYLLLPKT